MFLVESIHCLIWLNLVVKASKWMLSKFFPEIAISTINFHVYFQLTTFDIFLGTFPFVVPCLSSHFTCLPLCNSLLKMAKINAKINTLTYHEFPETNVMPPKWFSLNSPVHQSTVCISSALGDMSKCSQGNVWFKKPWQCCGDDDNDAALRRFKCEHIYVVDFWRGKSVIMWWSLLLKLTDAERKHEWLRLNCVIITLK